MAKNHPLFHKFKFVVGYTIATVVIIIALGVSGIRFLLTTANLYQNEVEQLASSLLKQPVKIGYMDAKLSGLMPTLIFHNVQLISKQSQKTLFSISRIDVGLLVDDLLWQQKITPAQLTVRGMDLHITRTKKGEFKIKGVDLDGLNQHAKNESNSLLQSWLLQQGEIGIEDSTFIWKDEKKAGLTWFFNDVNGLLKKTDERLQLLLSAKLPNVMGKKIQLSLDLLGDVTLPATWKVKAFVESKSLSLKPIQKYIDNNNIKLISGITDFKLWLDWEHKNIKQVSGDVKLYDFSYQFNKKKVVSLNLVSGMFDSQKDENNIWNVSLNKFNYNNNKEVLKNEEFSLAFKYKDKKIKTFYLDADILKLKALSEIVIENHLVSQENEKLINNLNVHGDIRNFHIGWKDNALYTFNADFNYFGINSWKDIPKIESLSGNIIYEKQKGKISLLSENAIIGFPDLFRDDFKLDKFNAEIAFSNTSKGVFFDVKNLTLKNSEVSATSLAKFWLPKDDTSSHLDLQVYVSEGDVSKISHFLPVGIMDKSLVGWLDKGLLEGKVEKSTIIFNGKLDDFPFDKKEGVFSVFVDTSGLTVDYQKSWPKIENAKVKGEFTGQGMKLHLLTGKLENNLMYASQAEITSFAEAELKLSLTASGSTHNTMKYMVNSPILPEAKRTVDSIRWLGSVDMKMNLNIPLDDAISHKKSLSYSGSAKLRDVSLFMLKDKLDITKATGDLFFTEKKISSANLVANILGKKATLSVTSLKNKNIKVIAKGIMEPGEILKRFDIPGARNISGSTSFNASMNFPGKDKKNHHPVLKLYSDLRGIKSTLPEYFYKRKKTRQKFNFVTVFTGDDKVQVGVEFAKKGSAILELAKSRGVTYLKKGAVSASSKKAILPNKNILYVDGSINKITPYKWYKALDLNKGKGKQTFFVNPIVFNLDKLKIVTNKNDNNKKTNLNPKHLPVFEGIIKKLYFDKVFYGRLDFKSSKKKYGLHFDELILSAKNMKLFSHGDWRYSRGKHKTSMDITLSSENFGTMLTDLGYAAIIESGKAQAVGKINWDGAVTQFSTGKINGTIQLSLENGSVIDIEPGAGRLLGLFSLSALPRKLFGDFKDTFKSGFNFDTAQGEIKIENGDMYSDDFEIISPVAEITVSGRTGFIDKDYENIVEVVPGVGSGIAGLTALLVNLPSGIGLWLIDKLTGEQINKASARTYEISGSWDEPEIELIEDE